MNTKKRKQVVESEYTDDDSEYNSPRKIVKLYNDKIDSIYSGEFFDIYNVNSLNFDQEYIEEEVNDKCIIELNKIKDYALNELPTIIEILKCNYIPINIKKDLIEHYYIIMNNEVKSDDFSHSYNYIYDTYNSYQISKKYKTIENKFSKNYTGNNLTELKIKILTSDMDDHNKQVTYNMYRELLHHKKNSEDYSKIYSWITKLLQVPFGIYSNIKEKHDKYLEYVNKVFDDNVSFLEEPKNEIINIIMKMYVNPNCGINSLGIYGKAGLGKTRLIEKCFAKCLNRPIKCIPLGGVKDASILNGHSLTYVSSICGRIIECLIEAKTMDTIIYLDELDKICNTSHCDEINGLLTHLIDQTQNNHFTDNYFNGINFDLSRVFFVFSWNDTNKVNKIVLDRIKKICVKDYTIDEKVVICRDHIIPELLSDYNRKLNIKISDENIKYFINRNYNKESGMRSIKHDFDSFFMNINKEKYNTHEEIIINKKIINRLYKNTKDTIDEHFERDIKPYMYL